MKTKIENFNSKKLNYFLKKNKIMLFLDWANSSSKTWVNIFQTNLTLRLDLFKVSINLFKNKIKKTFFNSFKFFIVNSLILGLIYKENKLNLTEFLKKLPNIVFTFLLKLNNKVYSVTQLKTVNLFDYFRKINIVNYIVYFYVKTYFHFMLLSS